MTTEKRPNRVFFAISLTPAIKQDITDYLHEIRKHFKRHTIRWIRADNLHITLQFLAAVEDQDLSRLADKVGQEIKDFAPFSLELGPLELFPTPYHPKIISLRANPHDNLKVLAETIGKGIAALNYSVETRPFRGHLSLGRIMRSIDHSALEGLPKANFTALPINSIVLYRSELTPEGARYTILKNLSF